MYRNITNLTKQCIKCSINKPIDR